MAGRLTSTNSGPVINAANNHGRKPTQRVLIA